MHLPATPTALHTPRRQGKKTDFHGLSRMLPGFNWMHLVFDAFSCFLRTITEGFPHPSATGKNRIKADFHGFNWIHVVFLQRSSPPNRATPSHLSRQVVLRENDQGSSITTPSRCHEVQEGDRSHAVHDDCGGGVREDVLRTSAELIQNSSARSNGRLERYRTKGQTQK